MALGARRVSECKETVHLIEQAGGEALFVETDVSVPEQVQALVTATVGRWQRLDFAVNNAGIEGTPFVKVADYSIDVWDQVIDINLKGVFLSMKYEVPELLKQPGSAIVNVSSVAGLIGGPGGSAYYASKHGVIGLTKAVAMEYAAVGLRVNAVCPAVIRTEMSERFFKSLESSAVDALHPMNRTGTPEEAADAILWLCSPQSSFVTGISLPVDGGVTAR